MHPQEKIEQLRRRFCTETGYRVEHPLAPLYTADGHSLGQDIYPYNNEYVAWLESQLV